jgi:hypothetical protein
MNSRRGFSPNKCNELLESNMTSILLTNKFRTESTATWSGSGYIRKNHFFRSMAMNRETGIIDDPHTNPDPITHEPGAHAVGTGVGAVVGGAAGIGGAIATGTVIGAVAGPVGMVAGAVVGAVAGGIAGELIAEGINPTIEEKYWRENYSSRPYALNASYDDYGPAYLYGWETYSQYSGRGFDEAQKDLERGWDKARGKSQLKWYQARQATRDAWDRLAAKRQSS